MPLRYTIRGQPAQIGDPAAATYPFSARYTYNPNSTLLETEFRSSGLPTTQKRYRYGFSTYDALNRIKGADYTGFSGSTPIGTLAYDLASITYDLSGNIKAMKRYRDAATLIDNLTYTYPSSSNRLSSVTDAVAATTESWDAETGSFTYDANGNMVTAPAPYSITAVTYNHQNLPVSLTRSGVTTTYRYDEAGQRLTKQVGTGNTEVYLREGATTLGVVTINSAGTAASWYFNLVSESRIVGRQPNTDSRSYYHLDMLGSTRAVVQGTTVVESYDYDPWGVLLAGRTLGSGTKERFAGKEQDTETGLAYFGARYYMAVLGRWASVDPLLDRMPQWSPYNYVYDDPVALTDPFGLCPECKKHRERIEHTSGTTSPGLLDPVAMLSGAAAGRILTAFGRAAVTAAADATSAAVVRGAATEEARTVTASAAEASTTSFFRGVTMEEGADIAASGTLRVGGSGNMGKYLTNTAEAAGQWGADVAQQSGSAGYQVWKVTVSSDATSTFTSLGRIDGIGQAWHASIEALTGAKLELVKEVIKEVAK